VGAVLAGRDHGVGGLLTGAAAGISGLRAPDLAFTFRWDRDGGANGYRGTVGATNGLAGRGTHGSGSPQELRATLLAAGPGVRSGVVSPVSTGQEDIVPTVFHILGLPVPPGLDGRPLLEAFSAGPLPADVRVRVESHAASLRAGGAVLEQRMDVSWAGDRAYVSALGRASDFSAG
jgi:arylsulfatase A-like enzyme